MTDSLGINRLERLVTPVCKLFAALGGLSLLIMAVVTTIDVLGRNLFSLPLKGALEIVSVGLVLTLFCGMPYAELHNKHIKVDILTARFSQAVQDALAVGIGWLHVLVVGILAWQCWEQGIFLLCRNSNTGIMAIPLAPFLFTAALSLGVFCIVAVLNLFKAVIVFHTAPARNWPVTVLTLFLGTAFIALALDPGLSPVFLEDSATGAASLILLFTAIFLGLPIASAMALSCLVAMSHLMSAEAALSLLGMTSKTVASNYGWSVAPLFIFMGVLVSACQFSRDIFDTAYKWLGHLKGGLASATIGACSVFAAVVGDSLSGVAAMGSIALPEMKKYKYDTKLSTGCVAVGGTLGILIPPSVGFIVYGLMTEQSIGKLFIAGLVPGILASVMLIAVITLRCHLNPALGPAGERATWGERLRFTLKSWHVLSLLVIVLGGIWLGLFTPNEAGAIGMFAALIIGLALRRLNFRSLVDSALESIRLISSIFFIFIYATAFTQYIAVTLLPSLLATSVAGLPIGKYGILVVIMLIYLVLGCVMNALPVIILTLPILYPTVLALGFDPIWFGVVVVILAELGQITPPIGMSVFALRNVVPDVPLFTIFAGTLPFWGVFIVLLALITLFPQIALFLPNALF
ncbi:TRAP transporter large permease subunit [Desulfovibrio aminophilus]|uniref:TRAP transporter large permease n=1 Tax=Desulfovibrio aminophilus TaxID=81425 RepID=UPI00339807CA